MRIVMILLAALAITACSSQAPPELFGSEFEAEEAMSIENLVAALEESSSVEGVYVEGVVVEVCQVKGCWMTLAREDGDDVRVTFKDYGFFMPMDIQERKVIMKGKGNVVTTSVDDLRHYAEDEGQSAEEIAAITEPKLEFVFEASGVKLLN